MSELYRVRTEYDPETDTLIIERRIVNSVTAELEEHIEVIPAYVQQLKLEVMLGVESVLPQLAPEKF